MNPTVYQLHYQIGDRKIIVQKPLAEKPTHDNVVAWGKEALGLDDLKGVTVTQVFEDDPAFVGAAQ